MTTITRSIRPTCPTCGFPVFNRRYAKCEKCQAELPVSIAYTAAELVAMRQNEKVDEDARAKRLALARAERTRRALGPAFTGVVGTDAAANTGTFIDAIDLGIDLSDLLSPGSD